ncbi:MAG: response regulator, partial [Kiritimatiellales bacterium]
MTVPTPENPARILIVDDHAIVRYGMGVLLANAPDLTLCGEAESVDSALEAVQKLKPDVAVIDIILQDQSGLDLIREIRSQEAETGCQKSEIKDQTSDPSMTSDLRPPTSGPLPILVMSMHSESTHAEKALRAGAQGYIMKENADEVLVDALRTVLDGKLYLSDSVNEKILRGILEGNETDDADPIDSLTDREKEIFECMGKGLTTRDMAERYGLSPRTVEVLRARIKKKLACDSAAQLLRKAVQWV